MYFFMLCEYTYEVRELMEVNSQLPQLRLLESNSSCLAWRQAPLVAETTIPQNGLRLSSNVLGVKLILTGC